MGARRCDACSSHPVVRCGRCSVGRCARHAFEPGQRCERCERDYSEDEPARRAAKLVVAPPLAILSGGLLFGLLMPLSLGCPIGIVLMGLVSSGGALGVGAGACRLVDRSSRSLFLREKSGALPAARLLPARSHR